MPAPAEADSASVSTEEVRRLRRLISNRESARRCRQRKQRYLEELRARVGRLRAENADLGDQLRRLVRRCLLVRLDNDGLRSEASALDRRLHDLALRLLQYRIPVPPFPACEHEQAWASLIA